MGRRCVQKKALTERSSRAHRTHVQVCVCVFHTSCCLRMLFCIPHSYLESRVMRWKWWHLNRKPVLLTLQPLWFSAAVIHCVTRIVCLDCHLLPISSHHICIDDERFRLFFYLHISLTRQGSKVKSTCLKLIICTLLVILFLCDYHFRWSGKSKISLS